MPRQSERQLSIVIPVYNEADCIAAFIEQLLASVRRLDFRIEYILVNDGSTDATAHEIKRLQNRFAHINGIHLPVNTGKDEAIRAGLRRAVGDAVVIIDGDGQHPPDLIPTMVDRWRESGAQVISGVRIAHGRSNAVPWQSRLYLELFYRLTGVDIRRSTDFKLIDADAVPDLIFYSGPFRFFRAVVKRLRFTEQEVEFTVGERLCGTTRWSFPALLHLAFSGLWCHMRMQPNKRHSRLMQAESNQRSA